MESFGPVEIAGVARLFELHPAAVGQCVGQGSRLLGRHHPVALAPHHERSDSRAPDRFEMARDAGRGHGDETGHVARPALEQRQAEASAHRRRDHHHRPVDEQRQQRGQEAIGRRLGRVRGAEAGQIEGQGPEAFAGQELHGAELAPGLGAEPGAVEQQYGGSPAGFQEVDRRAVQAQLAARDGHDAVVLGPGRGEGGEPEARSEAADPDATRAGAAHG